MSPLPLLQWFGDTPVARSMHESGWLLPAIETGHLLAYCVLVGTIVTVDLRLLGIGTRRQTAAQIAVQLAPWTLSSIVLAAATGTLLFVYNPFRFYGNQIFPFKFLFLFAALTFHYGGRFRLAGEAGSAHTSARNRVAAGLSLMLWLSVALAGLALSLDLF